MASGDLTAVNRHTPQGQIAFDIETLINECLPTSILTIGSTAQSIVADYVAQREALHQSCTVTTISAPNILTSLHNAKRHDVGIVTDTLEFMDKDQSCQLIAGLRDFYTERFVLVVRMGGDWKQLTSVWQTVDLLALGMRLVNRYSVDDKPIHIYKFDISTYKKTPEWLNSKNWANPELWGRFRW